MLDLREREGVALGVVELGRRMQVGLGEREVALIGVHDPAVDQGPGLPDAVAVPAEDGQRRAVANECIGVAAHAVQDDRLLHPGPRLRQPGEHGQGLVDRPERLALPAEVVQHERKAHPGLGGQPAEAAPLGQGDGPP